MDLKRIPEANIAGLEEAFAKLAKKAAKLGMEAPRLIQGEQVDVAYQRSKTSDDYYDWHEVKGGAEVDENKYDVSYRRFFMCGVEGSAPVIDGWALVSVIDHTTDQEIGNLIRDVPGMETPVEYRKSAPLCQHCNTLRRRNETFLLLKDGAYKQVGRNCLADFCRSPEMAAELVNAAEWLNQAMSAMSEAEEDEGGYGSGGINYYGIEGVLALTRCVIRNFGWVPKSAVEYGGMSTSMDVSNVLMNPKWEQGYKRDFIEAVKSKSEADKAVATEALEWIRAKRGDESLNDYMHNLLVVCSQERIPGKHFGLACSLIPAYMREMDKQVEIKLRATRAPSEHFGTVKKRETWTLTCTGTNSFESQWGVTTFVRFMDEKGNVAIWKASGDVEMERDRVYLVKGTVKEHGDYKGTKQTVLSRCACELIHDPEIDVDDAARIEHNAMTAEPVEVQF